MLVGVSAVNTSCEGRDLIVTVNRFERIHVVTHDAPLPASTVLAPVARTYSLRVTAVVDLTPRMRRVTLAGDALAGFAPWPGQDVVLHLTHGDAGVRRRYTVRHFDPVSRRLDVDFVLHGEGPGASWAQRARVGDDIEIFGPRGKVAMSDAGWQLFAGDESALPGIAEMVEALPAGVAATLLIEVRDAAEEQSVEAAARADLRWLHRGDAAPGSAELLERAVRDVGFPTSDRHVFFFGESRVVRRLRDIARARGLRGDEISAKGYWNQGRAMRGE